MAEVILAETILSFGVEKLWDLLVRETGRFKGVDDQLTALKSDLNLLRSFLKDADAKKHTNALVKNCVEEIKEIVYDTEDIIKTFVLKEELGKTGGIKKRLRRLSCIVVDRREAASDMEGISKRISKVISNMKSFKVQQMIVGGSGYSQALQERQQEMRHTFPNDNETRLVGLEQKVKKLVGYLVEEESSQVVSVIGMGGIGKTTLARQVFNHETINTHFDGVAWVCVSQQFTRKGVWQTILVKLSSKDEEHRVSNMIEDQLQEKLFRILETKKCLIVLDDIWKEEDWDRIEPIFPRTKGWKVLLTSRNEGVALRADPNCFTLKPDCLNPEESWELFRRIVFPSTTDYKGDEEREKIGKEMIKHCGGLPLAIKVLGGLLAPQNTLDVWTRVFKNIKHQIIGKTSFNERNISSVYHILCLSYEELPVSLKQCFLYLAHFPEDDPIDVDKLSYYWAGEGILQPRYYDGESARDVGEGYIEELVKRNMIIAERHDKTSRFQSCGLHDMMREVCLRKAEEENFVQIVDASSTMTPIANSELPCKSRRLVIQSLEHTLPVENPKLRSLLLPKYFDWKASELRFTRLRLMRVLDLSNTNFKGGKLPSSIGKLIHLRYLSLWDALVTHLPSSMRNLQQLIYLNLHVRGKLYMPNILKEMRELRYLELTWELHDKVKMELSNLVNLETLLNFSTEHGNVRDLQGMTRLKTLSISFRSGYSVGTLSSCLRELKNLEYLNIKSGYNFEEGFVLDCVNLRQLKLRIYMPRLPDEQRFPSRLTTIILQYCRLEEDPMPILEKLLYLKEVELWLLSFCGRRMVCSRGGFPQLQKLTLENLKEWEEWRVKEGSMPVLHTLKIMKCRKLEEWIAEDGSMPLLHTLQISYCEKLKQLRDGLRFINSLKDVSVQLSGEEWKNGLSEEHLPSRLTCLTLHNCGLEKDPMPILAKLLHLKEVKLEDQSFCGRRMVCSRGGFPQLQKLTLEDLNEWEEWRVEEGSMPILHTLEISDCKKLKELRDGGLRFMTSLKNVFVNLTGEEWKNGFSEEHLPSRLTSITIEECGLEKDPMPILEKLLHLKDVSFGFQSFCGKRMVCSRGGFPQLRKLALIGVEELEEWIVEEGSMPLLHTFDIARCKKLKELPDGLRFITSLNDLYCFGMGEEWNKRLSEGGEDYYKVQHIPSVKFK